MNRITELENRLIALTRKLETLSAKSNSATIRACISEVNELKYELELERQNLEAEQEWERQNIFDKD